MALPQWSIPLPQAPMSDGLECTPHAAAASTEFDKGAERLRHGSAVSLATYTLSWRMSGEAFRIFQHFYRDDLKEGTLWFEVPLWFGGSEMQVVTARFRDRWRAGPKAALSAIVSTELDVRGFPVIAPDGSTLDSYENALGEAVWPDSLPPFPLRTGTDIDPHAPVERSDFEGGPARKSNLFGASPGEVPVSWVMSAAQFESFKSFYWFGLHRGPRWFRMPLWFGGGLDEVMVRFRKPWRFSPHRGDLVLVQATLSVRRVPVVDSSVAAIFAAMSSPALALLVPSLHHFIHIDYPIATE